jgi:hypothetical protein
MSRSPPPVRARGGIGHHGIPFRTDSLAAPAVGVIGQEIDANLADAGPDTVVVARLNAKVLTFVADALESAVTSSRTPATNDPVEAPAPATSDKPAPSATEIEEASASVALIPGDG